MTVRTRFAPSPTGFLHLGSARTALFSFLYARHHGGEFLLRIEDTDRERSRPECAEDIMENLRWLGLNWDSEVIHQSERTELYREAITRLLRDDHAYYCFCSKETLEAQREAQLQKGEAPRYAGTCRALTPDRVSQKLAAGEPSVIRLRVPHQQLTFTDLICGDISWDMGLIGDFVIAKSEEQPLFHLATPIDDHLQDISHVIRGADLIASTPKQILISRALGWQPPAYAHLPLLLSDGGGKMSKREGSKSIREYRREGYLPETLLNFAVLLGWHPKEDKELISLKEMITEFDLSRVQRKGAALDEAKLRWLNRHYLRQKPAREIIELLGDQLPTADYNDNQLGRIIELGRERADTLNDISASVGFFFTEPEYEGTLLVWKKSNATETRQSLERVRDVLIATPEGMFTAEQLQAALESLHLDKGVTFWPLRVALTGLSASPPPTEIATILGKERTLKRIERALQKLNA